MLILGIDPGTMRTGVSILLVEKEGISILYADTIKADKLADKVPYIEELTDARFARNICTRDQIMKIMTMYSVDAVVSETPFMGKFAQSFAALTELLNTIRNAIFTNFPITPFYPIDPASVKKYLGVSGKSGDKELMRKALEKQTLLYENSITIESLDEHAIDSIAIGLWLAHYLSNTHLG